MDGHNAATSLYQPLDESLKQIRLLRIEPAGDFNDPIVCSLHTVSLLDRPKYDCLSYTWGDLNDPRTIRIDNAEVTVTTNLYHALQHLRSKNSEYSIWVDAVCINQADIEERGRQVAFMGEIYSEAETVQTWLGLCSEQMRRAFQLLYELTDEFIVGSEQEHRLYNSILMWQFDSGANSWNQRITAGLRSGTYQASYLKDPRMEDLADFFKLSYWRRIWIQQELALAKKVIVRCGEESLPLNAIVSINGLFVYIKFSPHSPFTTRERSPHMLAWVTPVVFNISGALQQLENVLQLTRSCQYTDPRDKIFGIVGLIKHQILPIEVDYSLDTHITYCRLVEALFRLSGNLMIDGSGGTGQLSVLPGLPNLPSWAPDFRIYSTISDQISWTKKAFIEPCASMKRSAIFSDDTLVLESRVFMVDQIASFQSFDRTRTPCLPVLFQFIVNNIDHVLPNGVPFLQAVCRSTNRMLSDRADMTSFFWLPSAVAFVNWFIDYCQTNNVPHHPRYTAFMNEFPIENEETISSKLQYNLRFLAATGAVSHLYDTCLENGGIKALENMPSYKIMRGFWGTHKWLDEQKIPEPLDHDNMVAQEERIVASTLIKIERNSLFMTEGGYVGVGPYYPREGDQICLIPGAAFPFIVRPKGDAFQVVGATNIYGMMDGELVDRMESGEFEQRKVKFV